MSDKLIIFDTTLRDGEQSPGASMTKDEKLRIARQLERLRVDVIEAGFAASSNGDFEAVKAIADHIRESTVCSLARANDRDISRAAEALKGAAHSRIHTFIATSALHMEKKLRMTQDQVFEQAKLSVRFARNLTDDIEFSPEDGYRSDPDFLCRVLEAVIAEGATTINIPDTVGYAIPELYGNFILDLRQRVPNADKAIWSVHCHNDLGMAVANSLAGVKIGGARQIECTINGLGERAGNCSLEEVVMAVKTRRDYFGLDIGIVGRDLEASDRPILPPEISRGRKGHEARADQEKLAPQTPLGLRGRWGFWRGERDRRFRPKPLVRHCWGEVDGTRAELGREPAGRRVGQVWRRFSGGNRPFQDIWVLAHRTGSVWFRKCPFSLALPIRKLDIF